MRVTDETAHAFALSAWGMPKRFDAPFAALGIDVEAFRELASGPGRGANSPNQPDFDPAPYVDLLSRGLSPVDRARAETHLHAMTPKGLQPIPPRTLGLLARVGVDAVPLQVLGIALRANISVRVAGRLVNIHPTFSKIEQMVTIALSDRAYWRADTQESVAVEQMLPDTLLSGLAGRPLVDFLRHPLTDPLDAVIASMRANTLSETSRAILETS